MSTKNTLENKKTSELLDLVQTFIDESGLILNDQYYDVLDELKSREPFYSILHPIDMELQEQIEYFIEELKKLKRHKHDDKTGDVLIRI